MFDVEILFTDSSTPKFIKDAEAVFTKGGLLVVRVDEYLYKYPLCNVFSVVHKHGPHWGSRAHRQITQSKGDCSDVIQKAKHS